MTTITAGRTTIARTGPEFLGVNELGYLIFTLTPQGHAMLARAHGRLVGAVPLYLKTNSYGEFIFDWAWANAAHRSGVRYYPKLVAAIPFTPATGHRLPVCDAPGVEPKQDVLSVG